LTKTREAAAFNVRATGLLLKGQYGAALADLNHSIELDPGAPTPYGNRGLVFLMTKHYAEAAADFGKEIAIKPNADSYVDRGVAYRQIGQIDKAISDYGEAIRFDPTSADASCISSTRGGFRSMSRVTSAV